MDCKEDLVDVSCFFLWEGSADSEADHHTVPLKANNAKIALVLEDEDAESCSSDSGDHTCDACKALGNRFKHVDERRRSWFNCKVWVSAVAGSGYEEEEVESKLVGVSVNNMDDMEDRLFWETCMAVGYP